MTQGLNILARHLPSIQDGAIDRFQSRTHAARNPEPGGGSDEMRAAAREFEAIFVSYLLKVMRETLDESGLAGGGLGSGIYRDLFDQEIARSLATRNVLGISDLLVRRLADREHAPQGGRTPPVVPAGPGEAPSRHEGPATDIPDFRLPVRAPVSSSFGPRLDPFTHEPRFHRGIDIAAPEGVPVLAALGGRVVSAGYEKGYGNNVMIEHEGRFRTRYAHLGSISVKPGDVVRDREVLGAVGNSGRSTGPHVHFEVSRSGERLDPRSVVAD